MSDDSTASADLKKMVREAKAEERDACIRICEDRLAHFFHGHGMTGAEAIREIIEAIQRRGAAESGSTSA